MRFVSPPAVLAASLVLCAAASARAQDGEGKKPAPGGAAPVATATTPLPWNPFANAKVGDWESVVLKAEHRGRSQGAPMQFLMTVRIVKVEGDTVSVKTDAQIPGLPPQEPRLHDFSRKTTPTIEELLSLRDETISNLEVTEEKKTVGGKELACTKLSYSTVREHKIRNGQTMVMTKKSVLWLSKDVKGEGLVAMTIEQTVTGLGPTPASTSSVAEVLGFGNEDTVEFGKKPGDIDITKPPEKK
jgi:hypothetical protein